MPDRKMLSKAAVCDYLGISRNTLERIVADGALPVYKIRGQCRFRPEDVDKYLASCRVQHVPAAQIIPRAARKAARDMAPEYYPGMRVV